MRWWTSCRRAGRSRVSWTRLRARWRPSSPTTPSSRVCVESLGGALSNTQVPHGWCSNLSEIVNSILKWKEFSLAQS